MGFGLRAQAGRGVSGDVLFLLRPPVVGLVVPAPARPSCLRTQESRPVSRQPRLAPAKPSCLRTQESRPAPRQPRLAPAKPSFLRTQESRSCTLSLWERVGVGVRVRVRGHAPPTVSLDAHPPPSSCPLCSPAVVHATPAVVLPAFERASRGWGRPLPSCPLRPPSSFPPLRGNPRAGRPYAVLPASKRESRRLGIPLPSCPLRPPSCPSLRGNPRGLASRCCHACSFIRRHAGSACRHARV